MSMSDQCEVAIVGGGPVGLLLACELGVRGIAVEVFDNKPGTSTHPKANTHTARSMEIYRRHGIAEALRRRGLPLDQATDIAYYTRLFGHELYRVAMPSPQDAVAETRQPASRWPAAEPQIRASQLVLEPLLLNRALSFKSVKVHFEHTVTKIAQGPTGANLEIQSNTGIQRNRPAQFVVGCDGGRSLVRREMGIRFAGEGGVKLDFMGGQMVATFFKAPGLAKRLMHKPTWQSWILLPHLRALMVAIDPTNDLFLLHYQLPTNGQAALSFEELLREVIGEEIPSEVLSSAEWRAGLGLVADHYRVGRLFIAGDAAHLFTPTGGFGLNTGIEDAFNLGWKLAGVCSGWAGKDLLDSYESERKPIAERNTAYALILARRNGQSPLGPAIEDAGADGIAARAAMKSHLEKFARWEFDTPGIQLGVFYQNSNAILSDADAPTPEDSPIEYVPTTVPGARLPHIWLENGASIYDLLGRDFTLIGPGESSRAKQWLDAASKLRVPLEFLPLADAFKPILSGSDKWLLVRPDQQIAWRGGDDADPETILRQLVGRGLSVTSTA